MKVLIIVAIIMVIFLLLAVFMWPVDPWVGNWVGQGGPNDKTTISGKAGNYSFHNTVTNEKLDLSISGNVISGYGNVGTRTNNVINWNVGNVWTKN